MLGTVIDGSTWSRSRWCHVSPLLSDDILYFSYLISSHYLYPRFFCLVSPNEISDPAVSSRHPVVTLPTTVDVFSQLLLSCYCRWILYNYRENELKYRGFSLKPNPIYPTFSLKPKLHRKSVLRENFQNLAPLLSLLSIYNLFALSYFQLILFAFTLRLLLRYKHKNGLEMKGCLLLVLRALKQGQGVPKKQKIFNHCRNT